MPEVRLLLGDAIELLRTLPDSSVDAVVTDPPAGISFMGKAWDHDKGGRDQWVAWMAEVMREVHRILKPGGHGLVWALPRTSHWTATAIDDAGFEVRDVITHLFGSGFPKSHDVSKAIDKMKGAKGGYGGPKSAAHAGWIKRGRMRGDEGHEGYQRPWMDDADAVEKNARQYLPGTPEALAWQGWGTALKPASEHWILVRKPVEGTVAENVLAWGTGGINVDECRIGTAGDKTKAPTRPVASAPAFTTTSATNLGGNDSLGRWPANVVFSHSEGCRLVGTKKVKTSMATNGDGKDGQVFNFGNERGAAPRDHAAPDGTETVESWECEEGCAVKMLDEQSGSSSSCVRLSEDRDIPGSTFSLGRVGVTARGHADRGGASRFFYVATASRSERNAGLDTFEERGGKAGELTARGNTNPTCATCHGSKIDRGSGCCRCEQPMWVADNRPKANHHPTVKPIALMRYLCLLITPKNGVVLDPFMGSGTTGIAAIAEGFSFIGVERDADYLAIAEARIDEAKRKKGLDDQAHQLPLAA